MRAGSGCRLRALAGQPTQPGNHAATRQQQGLRLLDGPIGALSRGARPRQSFATRLKLPLSLRCGLSVEAGGLVRAIRAQPAGASRRTARHRAGEIISASSGSLTPRFNLETLVAATLDQLVDAKRLEAARGLVGVIDALFGARILMRYRGRLLHAGVRRVFRGSTPIAEIAGSISAAAGVADASVAVEDLRAIRGCSAGAVQAHRRLVGFCTASTRAGFIPRCTGSRSRSVRDAGALPFLRSVLSTMAMASRRRTSPPSRYPSHRRRRSSARFREHRGRAGRALPPLHAITGQAISPKSRSRGDQNRFAYLDPSILCSSSCFVDTLRPEDERRSGRFNRNDHG